MRLAATLHVAITTGHLAEQCISNNCWWRGHSKRLSLIDFCNHAGQEYLIIIDRFLDCPEIVPMHKNTTTPHLTAALRAHFCRTGVPDEVWSDQVTFFHLFSEFATQWGFTHITSSPTYPQSNGKVEATVKSMKKLIRTAWTGRSLDEDKLTRALLQYRNTPSRRDGISPAQKLFGHPIQDTLPAHRRAFSKEWQRQSKEVEQQALKTTEAMERAYNQHARPLPDLTVGTRVAIQNQDTKYWDIYGIVTAVSPHRRYFVKTQSGRVLVRNRRFLCKRIPISTVPLEMPPHARKRPQINIICRILRWTTLNPSQGDHPGLTRKHLS